MGIKTGSYIKKNNQTNQNTHPYLNLPPAPPHPRNAKHNNSNKSHLTHFPLTGSAACCSMQMYGCVKALHQLHAMFSASGKNFAQGDELSDWLYTGQNFFFCKTTF